MTDPGTPPVIGVIGGSGVYDIDGLSNTEWRAVPSSFGEPSDELLFGEIDGQQIVFLPRHGRGHRIPPSELNFLANIDALKRAGVTEIISVSACGSFQEKLAPGTFVIVDQFVDRTYLRPRSFSAPAWWYMSVWRIRFAAVSEMRSKTLLRKTTFLMCVAGRI